MKTQVLANKTLQEKYNFSSDNVMSLDKIKEKLRDDKISLLKVARDTGISRRSLYNLTNGKEYMHTYKLVQILSNYLVQKPKA